MLFDISKNFYVNNNDINKISSSSIILETIKNILLIEPGDSRITKIGCGLKQFKFETIDTFNARLIMKTIENAILQFIPEIEDIIVKVLPKTKQNIFEIKIWVQIKNSEEIIQYKTEIKQ